MNERRAVGGRVSPLALAAGGFFLAGLAAFAPADIAAAMIASRIPGTSYLGAAGTIWSGEITGVVYDGIAIGDVKYSVRPLSLLLAKISIKLDVDHGSITGAAKIEKGIGSTTLRDVNAAFELSSIRQHGFLGGPYRGVAKLRIKTLKTSKAACIRAEGEVWTNALGALAERWRIEAGDLSGSIACDKGRYAVKLAGRGGDGAIDVDFTVDRDLRYRMMTKVEPRRADAVNVLRLWGFEGEGEILTYHSTGELKGVRS